ncbi:MAG: DUF1957 domain-containing protein [Firmicutes bacterium]|nr:DUF1957 domain-containing protein [Bacillota bacterium]
MTNGLLMLVFHAHLPYVRHSEKDYCLEENWLFEAITETYVPLLMAFEHLTEEKIDFRLTMTLSPTLLAMLSDGFLQNRYHRYLKKALELADKEKIRTWGHPHFHQLARFYRARLHHIEDLFFKRYRGNLVSAFRRFQDEGRLEIITCAATHGFLPLMQADTRSINTQIRVGVETYREFLFRSPQGIWLPECAYYPGLEKELLKHGLGYFFIDTSGVEQAEPASPYGVHAPITTPNGMLAFGRDQDTSRQVWCAQTGYPGDPVYRDFYRDLGFDLDLSYIAPYIDPAGIRTFTGFKYYRVSDKGLQKHPYDYHIAFDRARQHAQDFVSQITERCSRMCDEMDREPLVVSAYDAELLGHWWFEGPLWLEQVIRLISAQDEVQMITPGEYAKLYPENPVSVPAPSSWGSQGYYSTWLNKTNDWVYPHLYAAAEQMGELVARYPSAEGVRLRALNQALRELLLAQSSDWAFIMNNRTTVEYAKERFKQHLANFSLLYQRLVAADVDEAGLEETVSRLESLHPLFPRLDYRYFS